MAAEASQAVQTANQLLTVLGVSLRIKHVRECVSSLFVALFEGLLHTRIAGIQRNAVSRFDKIANVQRVISAFEQQVLVGGSSSLAHISAAEIVDGNSRHICNLMLLFGDLESAIHKSAPPMPSHDRDWSSQSQASLNSQDENSTKLSAQHSKPAKKQSSISSAGATQAVESAQSNKANSQTSAAPSTFSIPSNASRNSAKPRIKRGMSGASSDPHLLRVVDDVERYVLLEARRKADSELHSRVEDSLGTVQRDVEKRKRIVSDPSVHSSDMPPAKTNTRIQFNLKASSSSPISSLLQVQPTDTPHTRALKTRQQRLIAAKNEASARVESVSAFARRSMKSVTDSQKSMNKATVSAKTRLDGTSTSGIFKKITRHGRTRGIDLWIDDGMNDIENEGESENNGSDAPVSESYLDASEYDSDLADIESFLNKSADEEHISNESFPSDFEPGQTVSEEESFGYDPASDFHQSFDSERLFGDHGQTKTSIKEGASSSGKAAVASRNDEGPSIAERNFEEFEGIIKSQLGIKTIPKATKNVVWSGQLRDRRKQLDSRLHARKRNMHKEISTFSDVRPIQVLRKETEKAAFMKQSKREREAQRQAKIAVSEQKRRVVRMENRVSEVEGQVQSVTQKRQMREAQ
ncbi:hypothetical protein HDU77_002167, partial [Chytriomyces hyalinus]